MVVGEQMTTDDAGLMGFGDTSLIPLRPFPFISEDMTLSDPLLWTLPYWPSEPAGSGTRIPASELTLIEDEENPLKDKLSRIRDRWINPSFKPPSRILQVHGASAAFLTHVLKCYPKMMARDGSVPPMIHRLQLTSRTAFVPLVNCLAWTKIWEHRTGSDEAVLLNAMQGELEKLYQEHHLYGQADLLAALQASLIYSIIIYLESNMTVKYAAQVLLGQLQEMAYHLLITVTIPKARPSGAVLDQESWVITSAAHRTVLAVYIFEYVICLLNSLPVYSCNELDSIPAPVCGRLWEAQGYGTWRDEYGNWAKMWKGREVVMAELLDRQVESYAYNRVEKWLSEADEFGMLIFTGSLISAKG
ncbi:uncharacterized protein LY89DRAFT_731786 [Mollisia scopiformis]|uniref:Uncharacterized protein n=1 Tax=Mollisia scopiformis TaxID=149040 RepID=A0A194XHZ2_MOLSC|nr:uncharacterized protein LY89DRAFT_731786 [Mollisia scopiformis]KUJ19387.1 hypothetical protein LY89DRAFT_731786 [Mollisia scopiformis]